MASFARYAAFCSGVAARLRVASHPSATVHAHTQTCKLHMATSYPIPRSNEWMRKVIERKPVRTHLFFKKPPKENGGSNGGGSGGGGNGRSGGGGGSGRGGGGDEDERNPFKRLISAYIEAQERRPVLTKAGSTLVLIMMGDYCAQRISSAQKKEEKFELDLRRWLSVGTFGFCFMGPTLHYWYGILDRIFGSSAMKKMATDQLFFSIPFNSSFILGVGLLEGFKPNQVVSDVREKWWKTATHNWCLWIPAQYCNFAIVPKHFQMIYVNCVGFVWNVVLTYIAHSNVSELNASSQLEAA